ncbi:hypothetical protein DFH09DRAFT_1285603 [Mycena vulgaris]|nr:hypothetical protein DFH09DRAFT_1285603 [Mycena vulgaris]
MQSAPCAASAPVAASKAIPADCAHATAFGAESDSGASIRTLQFPSIPAASEANHACATPESNQASAHSAPFARSRMRDPLDGGVGCRGVEEGSWGQARGDRKGREGCGGDAINEMGRTGCSRMWSVRAPR